jgi:dihydroorotate dehydrogenase
MRVENHTDHVNKIPIMVTDEKTGHCAERDAIILLPGVNDVDAEKWAKIAGAPLVKVLTGLGRRGGFVVGDPKETIAKSLAHLSEADAKDTVAECVDKALLVAWRASEKRQGVLEAIVAQIDAIDPRSDKAKE